MAFTDIENGPKPQSEVTTMTEKEASDIHVYPEGGLQAWLVAAGGACIFFSTLGFANSFGVFEEYYLSHQLKDESADNVAWIGSLAAFLQFAAGAIGGPLFDRYGAWVSSSTSTQRKDNTQDSNKIQIIRPAAVLYVFAIMMTSLCHKHWQFMLAQGVLMGITMSLIQFPSMAAVTQYFYKKRAAALGAVISGSSIGGVFMPIALSKMLNSTTIGFGMVCTDHWIHHNSAPHFLLHHC